MMNVAAINAFIVYTLNNPRSNITRRELVFDYQKVRATWAATPRTIKIRLQEVCGLQCNTEIEERIDGQRGRCHFCDHKKNRKTKYYYCMCKKYLCLEHVQPICEICRPKS